MKTFIGVLAGLCLFNMMVQREAKNRLAYSLCFIAAILILAALEIIPLFLS